MMKLYGIFSDTKGWHLLDETRVNELNITIEQLISNWKDEIKSGWYEFRNFVICNDNGLEINISVNA